MKKQSGFLLLVAVLTALLLCGCSQYDNQYEDVGFLTGRSNHYAAILWAGYTKTDKSYALRAGSFSGVNTLRSFAVEENGTLCEVTSTLADNKGEAKLLVVNAADRTLVAQWPLDSEDPMTVTLPAGWYELRIAGKSAAFHGRISGRTRTDAERTAAGMGRCLGYPERNADRHRGICRGNVEEPAAVRLHSGAESGMTGAFTEI